jgi:hypothetical protein
MFQIDVVKKIARAGAVLALTACPADKDETTSSESGDSTATSTGTTGATTTGTTAPTTSDGTTGAPMIACEAATSEAECAAAVATGEAAMCVWLEVKVAEEATCTLEPPTGQCFNVEINDGGCATCLYRDLGGGKFEVIEDGMYLGCNNVGEFLSCLYGDSIGDPDVCACICAP